MLPRSMIKKGLFLTSGPAASVKYLAPARATEARRLEAQQQDDLQYHEDRLKELADERKQLAARMAAVKAKIAALGRSK